MKSLLIIGNGMASNRVLEGLDKDHSYDSITVLGDEKIPHYNRIMLSPLLAQETTLQAITPHTKEWYDERKISVRLGDAVVSIDKDNKTVLTASGFSHGYDDLIFATGSRSFIPSVPGAEHPDVIGFRTMTDIDVMEEKLSAIKHATVIGAGLLGVEAAVGLKLRGINVTLMHRNPVLMNRQLDATASALLEDALNARHIDIKTGVNPVSINSNGSEIESITFNEGGIDKTIATDLVIFATGITPNKELAEAAGFDCNRGICVNDMMQTSENGVYSLGECCEFSGLTYGLVAPIWDQAAVIVNQLLNITDAPRYIERSHLTKLKVSGLDIHSIGEFNAPDGCEVLSLEDREAGVYKKVILDNDHIIGALCVGDVTDSFWYYDLMQSGVNVADIRDMLLFGQAYCGDAA
ncbi:MAG: FAD-dependent oxidoreductase [Thalassolituus sp.]